MSKKNKNKIGTSAAIIVVYVISTVISTDPLSVSFLATISQLYLVLFPHQYEWNIKW